MNLIVSPQLTQLSFTKLKNGKRLEIVTENYERTILFDIIASGEIPLIDVRRTVHGTTDGPLMALRGCYDKRDNFHPGKLHLGMRVAVSGRNQRTPVALSGLVTGWIIQNSRA